MCNEGCPLLSERVENRDRRVWSQHKKATQMFGHSCYLHSHSRFAWISPPHHNSQSHTCTSPSNAVERRRTKTNYTGIVLRVAEGSRQTHACITTDGLATLLPLDGKLCVHGHPRPCVCVQRKKNASHHVCAMPPPVPCRARGAIVKRQLESSCLAEHT